MAYPFTYPTANADPASARNAARAAMRRASAALYAAGAVTMAISLSTPQPHRGSFLALAGVGFACALIAAVLAAYRRVPDWFLLAMPALGAVVISVPMVIEETATGSPFFYLWPALIAACFERGREILLTLAWIATCFAGVLVGWVDVPDGDAILFVDVVLAVGVTCGVVFALKQHVLTLVGRLHHTSRTDPLTGVLNRRAFHEALEQHEASGEPFVLALLDIDHFKQVNDTLGHDAGDRALIRFAAIVCAEKRHSDVFGRVGGEEFGLLLAGTGLDGAEAFVDRLRGTVHAETAADEAPLSVSIGIAAAGGLSIEELLKAADGGLYEAKAAGRNRVVVGRAPLAAAAA